MAQKEAEEEDKEMKDVLTDTHIIMTTMDLFGGKRRKYFTIMVFLQYCVSYQLNLPLELFN